MRVVDARVFDDLWDKVDENLTGDFGGRCFIVCPLSGGSMPCIRVQIWASFLHAAVAIGDLVAQ